MKTWKIYLLFLGLHLTNVSYNQKLPKDLTPNSKRRYVSTATSYSTVFILFDQEKLEKKVKIEPHLEYFYFRAGKIESAKGTYNGHLLNGEFKKEYRSKKLWESGCFLLGLKNGRWVSYYENGAIKSVENWKEGIMHGGFQDYDSLGNLVSSQNFENGVPIGEFIDPETGDKSNFVNGQKDGIWKVRNEQGDITAIETYKKGKLSGPKIIIENGDTIRMEGYKNGVLDGVSINYRTGDSVTFKNGVKNGLMVIHDNSKTDYLSYKDDQLHGICVFMENGDTLRTEEYKNGRLDGQTTDYKTQKITTYSKGQKIEPNTQSEEKPKKEKTDKPKAKSEKKEKKKKSKKEK